MKYLKSYKLFESSESESEPWADDASEIIRDYKTEFIDLGFDVSDPQVTIYPINAFGAANIHDNRLISCLYFEVSTPLDGIELVSECYDALSELESRLKNTDFGVLDISFEMYSDLPLMSLDNVYEVYGGTEWECLKIYIHKPIDRNEIEISSDDEWPFQNEEEE
jgi:hypothetical protein